MKKTDFDRDLQGPDSYEYFNSISKYCQDKYLGLLRWQLYCLLFIAFVSLFPEVTGWPDWIEKAKQFGLLIAIAIVFILMLLQHSKNYMEGWQKARYMAESILSNSWLLLFKYENYNTTLSKAFDVFYARIKEMKNEIDLKSFLTLQKKPNNDDDAPSWITENFDLSISENKEFYLENRLKDQIEWYERKAKYNRIQSSRHFVWGIIAMVVGLILTVCVMLGWIPNLSYLGLLTTVAASLFSWKQTKRFDELKTTYSVSMDELDDFKKKLMNNTNEDEIQEIIYDVEKAISREHKLWFSKLMD